MKKVKELIERGTSKIKSLEGMVEAYRVSLISSGAVKLAETPEGKYTLRSGGESLIYVDHGDLMCNPEHANPFLDAMEHYIRKNFPIDKLILVNVLSKSSPQITGALADRLSLRQILVSSKEVKEAEKGTERDVRLPLKIDQDDQFLVIDDVLTSGQTVVEVVSHLDGILKEKGIERTRTQLLVGLVRNPEKATSNLEGLKIKAYWITHINDVILQTWPQLSEFQRQGLIGEFPDLKQ